MRTSLAKWPILLTCFLGAITASPAQLVAAEPDPHGAESVPPAHAAGINLADLEQMALRGNPTLAQAAAQLDASRARALQAGLYPNPTIGYQGELIGVNGTPGEFQGGFVQQTIVTAGKLKLSQSKYDQEAREAVIVATGQQLRVLNAIRMRFFELLAIQRTIDLRSELLKNAAENLRTTREMFNTGLANEAEVLLAENEVSRAKIDLANQQNMYSAFWQHLVALLGNPDLSPRPLNGQLEPEGRPLDWEESLCRVFAESPELEAARAHVVHDQIAVDRERVEPIPDITIQAGVGRNYENPGTNANVQAMIQVPLFDRNQGTIREAEAELARSTADVRRIELSLRQRLADFFNQYRTALLTAQLYRDSMVPNAGKAYEVQLEMYKKRRIAWPEVVTLQRNLFQTQSEYIQSLLNLRQAEVAITGLLMLDGLTPPPSPIPGGHMEAVPKPR